jgi:hypothetical protein
LQFEKPTKRRGEERRGEETNNTLLPTSPCLFTAQIQDKNCEAPIPRRHINVVM